MNTAHPSSIPPAPQSRAEAAAARERLRAWRARAEHRRSVAEAFERYATSAGITLEELHSISLVDYLAKRAAKSNLCLACGGIGLQHTCAITVTSSTVRQWACACGKTAESNDEGCGRVYSMQCGCGREMKAVQP